MTGTIKTIHADKGYGFIRDDEGYDFFFHRNSVRAGLEALSVGTKVTFEEQASDRGPRATDIEILR